MKWVRVLLVVIVLATLACAQGGTSKELEKAHGPLKTFTSPDGAFQFQYPEILILCPQKEDAGTVPPKNCVAYHPVCDFETPEDVTQVVCLAYPKNKFSDTDAFEAATFSVEILKKELTAQGCVATPADGLFEARPAVTIHGVSFVVAAFSEGGMNQSVDGKVYRAFHNGKCYQMGINLAGANAEVFDPPARQLSKGDLAEINGSLEQARDSFRFLK